MIDACQLHRFVTSLGALSVSVPTSRRLLLFVCANAQVPKCPAQLVGLMHYRQSSRRRHIISTRAALYRAAKGANNQDAEDVHTGRIGGRT